METELPEFPVDDTTLDFLEHAMQGSYIVDEEGNHTLVGADFSLSQLYNFLSDYDESKSVHVGYSKDGTPMYDYPGAVYTPYDVIRALIAEVRRLRAEEVQND